MSNNSKHKPSFWQVLVSTVAAAIGVQTRKNQERDFTHGSIYTYIVAGIVFTVAFVLIVRLLVNLVLQSHGL